MVDEEKESAAGDAQGQNETELHPMDALLESEDYELNAPKRGEIRVGTIVRATDADVLVDIGAKSEGVIPARELEQLPQDQRDNLEVGQEISVYVVRPGGRSGAPELSLARAEEEQDWHHAEELLESKEIFEGEVTGYNKGGLIVRMGQLRGFVPASQVSLARRRRADGETPEDRWGKMVGEHLVAKVIEVDRRRNRLILSERSAAREAREALKERLISELAIGEIRTGHVISLADFGAFVDIGGADGLVHISEISWKRVSNPREVLSVGQEVRVKVLGVDPDRNRISLSIRELEDNPWDAILSQYDEGQLVEGTITKLTKFGAFAKLAGLEDYGIEGLIHISELSDRHIAHPSEVVQEGHVLTLRVIRVDAIRHRIGLSLKRVESSDYADMDWEAAVQEAGEVPVAEPVADFDAELEAEEALNGEVESPEQVEPAEAIDTAESEEPADEVAADESMEVADESEVQADEVASDEAIEVADESEGQADEGAVNDSEAADEPEDSGSPAEAESAEMSEQDSSDEIEQPSDEVETEETAAESSEEPPMDEDNAGKDLPEDEDVMPAEEEEEGELHELTEMVEETGANTVEPEGAESTS